MIITNDDEKGPAMVVNILFVDDEPDMVKLMQRKFRRQIRKGDYNFLFASDGVEALDTLAEHPEIDIIVSDINMPRMDGLTLLDKLNSQSGTFKALIVSAYGDMDNIRVAMNRGAFDFVTKPINFDDLESTIIRTMDELTTVRGAIDELKSAERERANLARHFSPNLVNQLATNSELVDFSSERRFLTFVISDLADFTPLVETMEPSAITPLLNEYLDAMTRIVFDHGGTVDKVVGDAVHAMFGAPEEQPDQATKAVACSLAMDAFATKFAADKNAEGIPLGMTRIGVHSGLALVGNFGGEHYFDYTAYGDAINTAARLEGANKFLGTRICVSENTVEHIDNFKGRPIGTLMLKGKEKGIVAFEPISDQSAQSDATNNYVEAFELMAIEDPKAKQSFATHVGSVESDTLATFHLQRLLIGETGVKIVLSGK
jgi:adenylate cyclase